MIDRIGRWNVWIAFLLIALMALPLLAWKAFPQPSANDSSAARLPQQADLTSPGSPAANTERGRDLFMGRIHFENGGPPCMGCHSIGSNGLLGGGALGPDLTNVAARRSPSELAEVLANPGPVAKPIYAEHPLTAGERADLLAFINASVGQPETNREWLVLGISLLGFGAAVGLIELVYHRRLRGVRQPMLRRARFKE